MSFFIDIDSIQKLCEMRMYVADFYDPFVAWVVRENGHLQQILAHSTVSNELHKSMRDVEVSL